MSPLLTVIPKFRHQDEHKHHKEELAKNGKNHPKSYLCLTVAPGADPGFFLGGGALVSCSISTPINHIVFFLQNTSCIRKLQVISGGGGAHPLHPPPRSAPELSHVSYLSIESRAYED